MYFRQGQLMCIEPQQGHVPLERRLLRAGVISLPDLQEVEFVMSTTYPVRASRSEVQVALALAELGLVSHEKLYAWMRQEAIEILKEPLTWSAEEVSFAEGVQPPVDRLPLALCIASLLPPRSGPVYSSSLPVGKSRAASPEPSFPIAALSTLFKTPKLLIEESSMPATPGPLLFKKPKPAGKELSTSATSFPTTFEATSPVVQEQRSPTTTVHSLCDAETFID